MPELERPLLSWAWPGCELARPTASHLHLPSTRTHLISLRLISISISNPLFTLRRRRPKCAPPARSPQPLPRLDLHGRSQDLISFGRQKGNAAGPVNRRSCERERCCLAWLRLAARSPHFAREISRHSLSTSTSLLWNFVSYRRLLLDNSASPILQSFKPRRPSRRFTIALDSDILVEDAFGCGRRLLFH